MELEDTLKEIIESDESLMKMLKAVASLQVNDSWICAGIIRGKVWDCIHQCKTPLQDIDVIFYDSANISEAYEKELENKLATLLPGLPWSVKNQARMHKKNNLPPFCSSYEGVAHFPETPTAVAVKIQNEQLILMAPYGLEDLFHMVVRPTPKYETQEELHYIYKNRMAEKQWNKIWPDITIY
jgi:uncharacterized protein